MREIIPPKVYKYQSLGQNTHTLENLRRCNLYFAKPAQLNDPFDLRIPFLLSDPTDEEWKLAFKRFIKMLKSDLGPPSVKQAEAELATDGQPNQKFRELLIKSNRKNLVDRRQNYVNMGVACFSATPCFLNEFDIMLMWSHYADGHRGICLEFDTSFFPFNQPHKFRKVRYDNQFPILSPVEFIMKGMVSPRPLITKSRKWKYEREWRLLKANGGSTVEYDPKALTGIYFGSLAPDEDKHRLVTMPATSAPHLFQMAASAEKFELECHPFHC